MCNRTRHFWALRAQPGGIRSAAEPLRWAPPSAWATKPCSGLDQRDPEALLYGRVGGPGAVGLPTPVDDLRTETRAVWW